MGGMRACIRRSSRPRFNRPSAPRAVNRKPSTEVLDDRTPASCYIASCRQMPRRVPELEYGNDVVMRRISQQGSPKTGGERTFVSEIFAHEWMGLRALHEHYFEVVYALALSTSEASGLLPMIRYKKAMNCGHSARGSYRNRISFLIEILGPMWSQCACY